MNSVFRLFERWVDPFREPEVSTPPDRAPAFLWHYVSQAKGAFIAMLILGGLVALMEAALFWFVGRLVDLLTVFDRAQGWDGLMAGHGPELLGMLAAVVIARTLVVSLSSLVEEQTIVPGFFSMVRWQAHRRVSRQSYAFFQNDFAGRLVTKVWQTGQATGDFMVSLLQVIWFSVVYTVTTIALVGSLDLALAAVVVIWLTIFGLLGRHFLPRVRKGAREAAEASSMINGRLVDGYSNVQTLKLFGTHDRDDAYIRDGMQHFIDVVKPFTRGLSGIRISLGATSGVMISVDRLYDDRSVAGRRDHDWGCCLYARPDPAPQYAAWPHDDPAQQSLAQLWHPAELDGDGLQAARRTGYAWRRRNLAVAAGAIAFENVRFNYGKGRGAI